MSSGTRQNAILAHLSVVEQERSVRRAEPGLAARVQAIKQYQQRRFTHSYADLLASERFSAAARFFLDELYGPKDFSERDAQFARVVPALVRLFPDDIVATVEALASLHALSEQLDTGMGRQLGSPRVGAAEYIRAWQAAGQPQARRRQVELLLSVGRSLDVLTRKLLFRQTLRMMRGPARAAGLTALQDFLETGFETFRAMRGADEFLALVSDREGRLGEWLFSVDPASPEVRPGALGQLP